MLFVYTTRPTSLPFPIIQEAIVSTILLCRCLRVLAQCARKCCSKPPAPVLQLFQQLLKITVPLHQTLYWALIRLLNWQQTIIKQNSQLAYFETPLWASRDMKRYFSEFRFDQIIRLIKMLYLVTTFVLPSLTNRYIERLQCMFNTLGFVGQHLQSGLDCTSHFTISKEVETWFPFHLMWAKEVKIPLSL